VPNPFWWRRRFSLDGELTSCPRNTSSQILTRIAKLHSNERPDNSKEAAKIEALRDSSPILK
jgi:hypothetical protein